LIKFLNIILAQSIGSPLFAFIIKIAWIRINEITNLIPLINYLNKCRKMNMIYWIHLTHIPQLCVYVNIWQHLQLSLTCFLFLPYPPTFVFVSIGGNL
jgi:hypothetical protein